MPVSNTRSLVLVIFILASYVSDVLARHHHIKLRHGRHRRQHGDSYLPPSFVLDTNEEETGNWGPWSTPSSCSRSCGGGVAHQTRRCHDLTDDGSEICTGSKRRFFSCNIQDCPDPTNDFRAEQCAAFNNKSIEGITYEWIPYTGSPNKCELNCMPQGERFFYHFNETVMDGTLCTTEGNDICVEGRCMPVGCDMMLGSRTKEDKCRECGGNGSACNTVKGLMDDNLQVGYVDILLIPEGATNIAISEVRPSNNYLAIRNGSGHYYLNGNWRIDFPRSLRFAGTVFHYERRPKGIVAADIIRALGPITESIYIVMLFQDKNVGVDYEYSVPKRFSQYSDPDSYTWVEDDFSDCSASCGGGFRSRRVKCVRRRDYEEADDNLCDQQLRPDDTVPCGDEPCPPGWVLGDWGPCNKKCGPGGEQSRAIQCEQIISGGIPSLVDDYRCLELIGPKDIEIRECNTDIVCPEWHTGPWKPCDRLCGEGKEKRQVTCFKKVNGKIVVLPDSDCEEERPESEKDCDLRPCAAVDWVVSKWSGCDDKCGLTQETRTTSCVTLEGKVYPDGVCNPDTKPKLVRECAAQEKCNFQWYASQWSECSARCGTGIQTRKVFCGTSLPNSDTITKVDDNKCDITAKYNATKECTGEFEECKGEWFAGPWSECSKPCGGGDMNRKVICMKDNKVVPSKGNCYADDIMFSKESCNENPCEEDGVIPVEVGKPSPSAEDEEECEEYEDNEFVTIDFDLDLKGSGNISPNERELIDSGLDGLMMGDDPNLYFGSTFSEIGSGDTEGSGAEEFVTTDGSIEGSGTEQSDFTEEFDSTTSSSSSDSTENFSETGSTSDDLYTTTEASKSSTTEHENFEGVPAESPASQHELSKLFNVKDDTASSMSVSGSASTSSGNTDTTSSSQSTDVSGSDETEYTTDSATTDSTVSSSSATTESVSSESITISSSDSIPTTLSSSETVGLSSSEATVSSSETEPSSSTEATVSSAASEITILSSSETGGLSSSESTVSGLETEPSSTTEATVSSAASETTILSSSETGGLSSSESTVSGLETEPSSTTEATVSSAASETTIPSSSETGGLSSSESTVLSSETEPSSSTEATLSSAASETTASLSSETEGLSSSKATVSGSETEPSFSTEATVSSAASETTVLSSSETVGLSSSESGVSSSETKPSSSTEATVSSAASVTTASLSSETEGLSSSKATVSGSETEPSSSTEATISSAASETTVLSSSETVGLSSSESTVSSSETKPSSSSETTVSSAASETTVLSSLETVGLSSSESTVSSSETEPSSTIKATVSSAASETTILSSSETVGLSSSEATVSSSETKPSSSTEATVFSAASETTASSSSETVGSSSSESTVSSSETEPASTIKATVSSAASETTASSSSDTTVSGYSFGSSETTVSGISTDISTSIPTEASEQFTGTGTKEISESEFVTESWETTFSGESVTTMQTGLSSETTQSGVTETDEDLDTTEQSHITDIWTSFGPTDQTTRRPRRKCKPRKIRKTCKSSPFGCCYDGIKAATGPFGKGCPIPRTCQDVEFGCCQDGVSPATGPNYEGCPESHCSETLFGCCKDNETPAQGNDYEGCPIPCNQTEFGCCPDEKTPAAGKDNLGCCNTTEYGCCPDGIAAASGPDGKGCKQEETSTATTPAVSTLGVSTTTASTSEASTSESSTSEASTYEASTSEGSTYEASTSESSTSEASTSEVSKSVTTESTITTTEGPENCTTSEFGCCPDGEAEATGRNFGGCGVINKENCTASYFGCCPDRTSAALGPDNEGCPNACVYSLYGCCDDGSTPAHGPNKEGCCLVTPYGCCPDNIRHAIGPKLHGCGCQYSRYGCCPDNRTIARGLNNEGCGCEYTDHGCCPNRLTPATGPNFEGCPCTTYQFGCCSDGVSIAKGQFGHGCRCENTEFKCCSDGITPAKGPNYAGCTCDASKYGCCPDGVEEAQGESFEGCLTVITPRGADCALGTDRGSCWNFTVKWFFDTKYGGCSRFWYGGCEGNGNRFKSQEECKDVCVAPKGRDACFLPKSTGSCPGKKHLMWYYDADRKQCGQFHYSGCLGNTNKFKTRDECEELCVVPDDLDPCEQPKEEGPCEGNFTRWYFDKESNSCEQFNYGGCKANKNNFRNQVSCQQQCLIPGRTRVREVCVLEKDPGPCPGSLMRWYYDTKHKSCRQFVYGGCKGNGNKFRTYAACEQRCLVRDSCTLPREVGNCGEKLARWSFNQSENRCMPFYYTGCGGNKNNYETSDACDNDCPPKIEPDICVLPAVFGECRNDTIRWYYDSFEKHCRQFYYGGCGGNENNFETEYACINRCEPSAVTQAPVIEEFRTEFCFLPNDHGPCNENSVKWFYDSRYGICDQFRYGGCEGNGNKFETAEECETRCGNVQDPCVLPQFVGSCRALIPKYYYDSRSDTCQEFMYGGCQGNQNNFGDKTSCEQRCRKSTDAPTTPLIETTPIVIGSDPRSPACSAPLDVGSCFEDVTAYYYNEARGECQAFLYGGCDGNANRFGTEEQCERICGKFRGQDVCNLRADPGPCRGKYSKFYYDPVSRGCREFSYGGCDGNANRFTTETECESICIHREEPPVPGNRTTVSNSAICKEPVSVGTGSLEVTYKRFYYNDEFQTCIGFIYSGIGGNLNRFKSFESCSRTCSKTVVSNEIDDPNKDPCLKVQTYCDTLQCQYGKEEMVDRNDCPSCICADPCRSTNCPEGTQCIVRLVALDKNTEYESECRPTLKPGICPNVLNSTTCEKECTSDAECDSDFKCCINGCGSSCLEPASTEPSTTPPPVYVVSEPPSDSGSSFIKQPKSQNISAAIGGYVTMDCVVIGDLRAIISWRKGDTLIDNSLERYSVRANGSLQIVGLDRRDEGIYTCTAENRPFVPLRIQYILSITPPRRCASIILGEPNYQITVSLNAPALLPCRVSGWPRPSVQWWRENQLVPTGTGVFDIQLDHSLRIRRVDLVNLGVYTCQAYNGIESATSWSITLRAPGPVYNVNPKYKKYMIFLIDPPRSPITTDATQRPQTTPTLPASHPTLPVVPSTELPREFAPIIYRVPVKVNISADGESFPEGSEFSIGCYVDGYPYPNVTWYKDDKIIEANNRIRITDTNRIVIAYAERNDTGRYRCEAANEYTSDSDTVDIEVAGIYIHPNCQDNELFATCHLIVKGRLCNHKYYSRFCCRSCTKAGQLPARGSHLNETERKRRSILSFF